jgi:predicted DNA-binding protein
MAVARCSISISFELDQALDALVARSGQPKSKLIEILMRENRLVQNEIESLRLELKTTPAALPGKKARTRPRRTALAQRA